MKIKNKIIIFILFLFINLFLTSKVFAATLTIIPSKNMVGIGEQFYVDIMLNPEGQSVNTISGTIFYSNENISFIRAEDSKSMVNLWIEKPKQDGNKISFAGVMPNGFNGVIDPFNPKEKLPGPIVRLIFEPKNQGEINFSTSSFSLNLNNGLGTAISIPPVYLSMVISDLVQNIKYKNNENMKPELEAYVTRDPDIYDNKYILVFKASDKGTGIKNVMIKEGRHGWKEIESPYLLIDQSRHSSITLQANNFSGASIILEINKVPYDWKFLINILAIVVSIIGFLILIIVKKVYARKN